MGVIDSVKEKFREKLMQKRLEQKVKKNIELEAKKDYYKSYLKARKKVERRKAVEDANKPSFFSKLNKSFKNYQQRPQRPARQRYSKPPINQKIAVGTEFKKLGENLVFGTFDNHPSEMFNDKNINLNSKKKNF